MNMNLELHTNSKYRDKLPAGCAYVFAMKWDGTLEIFDIHGLWPQNHVQYYDTLWNIEDVSTTVYKTPTSSIEPIVETNQKVNVLDVLSKNWNSSKHLDNEEFWNHEWTKHGRCMLQNYFEKSKSILDSVFTNYTRNDILDYCLTTLAIYNECKKETVALKEHHQIYDYLDVNFNKIERESIRL